MIVNIFALIAFNRLNIGLDTAMGWITPEIYKVKQSWNIIDLHNRWDAAWYLDIAEKGYYLRGEGRQANVVFFPLYPLLVRLTGYLTGGSLVLAGWIVSSVFLALSVAMLTRLTQEFHPEIDPARPALFLLVFPTAFFLNAVYTESLFLFLSLCVVFFALKRKFIMAGLCAALASATRVAGVFLFVVLLVEFIQAYGWRALFTTRVWPLLLAPLGIVVFFLHHWIVFGDFFLYLEVQKTFGRDFQSDMQEYLIVRNNPDLAHTLLDLTYTLLAIVAAFIVLKRFRLSYGLYMLVTLAVALSTGTALGIARYAMVMFPIYLIGAGIRSNTGRNAWLFISTLFLALNITRFVHHNWAG
ncbi:MAG: mannosyltransferase family protein [Desulfobacterales bacterium]